MKIRSDIGTDRSWGIINHDREFRFYFKYNRNYYKILSRRLSDLIYLLKLPSKSLCGKLAEDRMGGAKRPVRKLFQ